MRIIPHQSSLLILILSLSILPTTSVEADGDAGDLSVSDIANDIQKRRTERALLQYKRLLAIGYRLLDYDLYANEQRTQLTAYFRLPFIVEQRIKFKGVEGRPYEARIKDVLTRPQHVGALAGDLIRRINGEAIISAESLSNAIKAASTAPMKPISLILERDGKEFEVVIDPIRTSQDIHYHVGGGRNDLAAFTDGKKNICVTPSAMSYFKSDDELAFVIAHEIAHIQLGHYSGTVLTDMISIVGGAAAGIFMESALEHSGGLASNIAYRIVRSPFSKEMEKQADIAAVAILRRAGFDVAAAQDVLKRFAVEMPMSNRTSMTSTHPSSPERIRYLAQISETRE